MYVLIKWYDSHRQHVENCYWITNFVILIIMAMVKRLFCLLKKKGFPFGALCALCCEGITRKESIPYLKSIELSIKHMVEEGRKGNSERKRNLNVPPIHTATFPLFCLFYPSYTYLNFVVMSVSEWGKFQSETFLWHFLWLQTSLKSGVETDCQFKVLTTNN